MRIRSIKPEFWRSQDVADLPRDIRLLWIGLWSYVDDNGVGIDDHRAIAADLFAFEDDPNESRQFVRDGLATLSRALRVTRYTVEGVCYIHISNWDKHQRVDRPNKARYPLPPNEPPPDEDHATAGHEAINGVEHDTLATPSRELPTTPPSGTGEQGNRGTGKKSAPRTRTRGATTTSLDELNDTAAKPPVWKLVQDWHANLGRPYPNSTIRHLRKHVEKIHADPGHADDVDGAIRRALDLWHQRVGASPGLLPRLYDDALRERSSSTRTFASTREDKVNAWLNFDPDAPDEQQPYSAREAKVNAWLNFDYDAACAAETGYPLTSIEGGKTA